MYNKLPIVQFYNLTCFDMYIPANYLHNQDTVKQSTASKNFLLKRYWLEK